jgi:hypothetical protein
MTVLAGGREEPALETAPMRPGFPILPGGRSGRASGRRAKYFPAAAALKDRPKKNKKQPKIYLLYLKLFIS